MAGSDNNSANLHGGILPPVQTGLVVEEPTFGDKAADWIAARVGSWPFIIIQAFILASWVVMNVLAVFHRIWWDKPPFILLNLVLSFQAAFTGPIVMIAQNRAAKIASDNAQAYNSQMMALTLSIRDMNRVIIRLVEDIVEDIDEQKN